MKTLLLNGRHRCRVVYSDPSRVDVLLEDGSVVNLSKMMLDGAPAIDDFKEPVLTPEQHQKNLGKAKTDRDLYVYASAYLPADVVEELALYHQAEEFSFASRKVSVVSKIKELRK